MLTLGKDVSPVDPGFRRDDTLRKWSAQRMARWIVLAIGVPIAGVVLILGNDVGMYLLRSPANARGRALIEFHRICSERHLDEARFVGPEIDSNTEDGFGFLWRDRSDPGEQIIVSVSYLPFDVEGDLVKIRNGKFVDPRQRESSPAGR